MKILLFGVSNVGKSTTGALLARRLGIPFYDLDDEIKKKYGVNMEDFVNKVPLRERDRKRGVLVRKFIRTKEDLVLAVTPMTYIEYIEEKLYTPGVLAVELYDSAENIFSRLIFTDENDNYVRDDEYRDQNKAYFMREILGDLNYYGRIFDRILVMHAFDMEGDPPERVVERLLEKFFVPVEAD